MGEFRRVPLVTHGQYQGFPLYEPALHLVDQGKRISCRAEVLIFNQMGHVCQTLIGKTLFTLEAELTSGVTEISILYGKVGRDHRGTSIALDKFSHVLPLEQTTTESLYRLKEVCTGIGGLGVGAEMSGFHVSACVEKQTAFCEVLRELTEAEVIEGDMSWIDTIAELHHADPHVSCLGFGFNCQSFSKAGDMRGGLDERSMTLPWGLWIAYILKAPIVTMECAAEAPTFTFVKKSLQQYQEMTGSHLSEIILDLKSLWPSARRRWWAVLTHPKLGKVPLMDFPSLPRNPVVSDVLPSFSCTDDVRVQLELTQAETVALQNLNTDFSKCSADLRSSFPTALHSWANQLIPCQCGCRPHGLGSHRLSSRVFLGH